MIREWSMFCMSALPTSPMVRRYCKQLNICIRLIQTISVYWTNRFYCTSELYVQTTLSITQSHQIHFVVVDCWMYLQQNKTIVLRHHQYVKCPEEILKRTHIYANIIHKTQHQYKNKKKQIKISSIAHWLDTRVVVCLQRMLSMPAHRTRVLFRHCCTLKSHAIPLPSHRQPSFRCRLSRHPHINAIAFCIVCWSR